MPAPLFWTFAALTIACAILVVCLRNPVSSALAMVGSFLGLAALFIGLDAFFVGIIQILVYAGAIMVLFLFIIMLLDLKAETRRAPALLPAFGGILLAAVLVIQLLGVLGRSPDSPLPPLDLRAGAAALAPKAPQLAAKLEAGALPDVHLVGQTLFTGHNLSLQIVGALLLVSTVGVVTLSQKAGGGARPPAAGGAGKTSSK
jgi:NADH-quinone oxidoreductase subunit J